MVIHQKDGLYEAVQQMPDGTILSYVGEDLISAINGCAALLRTYRPTLH